MGKSRSVLTAVLLIGVILSASSSASASEAPTLRWVVPSATDAAIGSPDDPHSVALPTTRNGKLVVFLPGSGARPADYRLFVRYAAMSGYHAIGLGYRNDTSVGSRCGDDLDCYGSVRQAVFDGAPSPHITVSRADSIVNRLTKLLTYLDNHRPSEGWSDYLANGGPAYQKIIFAGHSQGGGQSAFIASRHVVGGVVQFSATVDANASRVPAAWVTDGHITPSARYTGFVHVLDPYYDKIRVNWTALGMGSPGGAVDVGSTPPPYRASRELLLSRPAYRFDAGPKAHAATVADKVTPTTNGRPDLAPVWKYLIDTASS